MNGWADRAITVHTPKVNRICHPVVLILVAYITEKTYIGYSIFKNVKEEEIKYKKFLETSHSQINNGWQN